MRLLVDAHQENLLGEFDQQANSFANVVEFEELYLILHVKEDFAHNHLEGEDEDFVVLELLHLEVKVFRLLFEDEAKEIQDFVNLDDILQVVAQIASAIENGE